MRSGCSDRRWSAFVCLVVAISWGCSDSGTTDTSNQVVKGDTGSGSSADGSATAADGSTASDAGGVVTDAGSGVTDAGAVVDSGSTTKDAGGSTATDASAAVDVPSQLDVPVIGFDTGAGGAPADAGFQKVCNLGQTQCAGAKLASCGPQEDGWIISNCFPGLTCSEKKGVGGCMPVSNNLVIAFDTSGSMTAKVPGCNKGGNPTWPACDPNKGCSRMDISKVTFKKALQKIDSQITRMALFRFPQKLNFQKSSTSCTTGYYQGQSVMSGEKQMKDAQTVNDKSNWYWDTLNETLCVPFPKDGQVKTKTAILKWMDGTESKQQKGSCGSTSSVVCNPTPGCAGSCCPGNKCIVHNDPELRPTGGTPIGKTLFYIGEYLRNRVVVDGKPCTLTSECGNVNYVCKQAGLLCETKAAGCTKGKCVDPARSCRETVVVLFTDGGQSNNNSFFAPWVQAKRLGFGLGCQVDADCVGGAKCKVLPGTVAKHCRRGVTITDYYCTTDMKPCLPGANLGEGGYCSKECVRDPMSYQFNDAKGSDFYKAPLTAVAGVAQNNVLRSPDGKPFGVSVYVVDISSANTLKNSMSLSLAGNGKLLGTDAADPDKFLSTLNKVFDIKNLKVCGETQ